MRSFKHFAKPTKYGFVYLNRARYANKRPQSTRKYLLDDNCYIDAGKIKVMLTLLDEYKAEGRRVLIFSQVCISVDFVYQCE